MNGRISARVREWIDELDATGTVELYDSDRPMLESIHALATEAQRAATLGSVHEGAGRNGNAKGDAA